MLYVAGKHLQIYSSCLILMAQISEIVTQSESSEPVTVVSEQIIGELSIFGEDQSSRTRLCSALGQTISPTERWMKACKSNPVQWCERFLGKIKAQCVIFRTTPSIRVMD